MRILATSAPNQGHFYPMVPLLWALRNAGHDVLVALPGEFADVAATTGLSVARLGDLGSIDDLDGRGEPRPSRQRAGATALVEHICDYYVPLGERNASFVVELAESWKPDLLIHTDWEYAGPIAAARLGIPTVLHGWGMFPDEQLHAPIAEALAPLHDKWGVTDSIGSSLRYIDICPPTLQKGSVTAPVLPMECVPYTGSSVVPVTGLVRDGGPRRILLTLGNIPIMGQHSDVMSRTLEGLSQVDADIVVAGSNRLDYPDLPPRVELVKGQPLSAIIPGCDLVIHHGGAGSALATLSAGLPALALPQMCVQYQHADRIAEVGAGLSLHPEAATAEAVRDAVDKLLDEPGPREVAGTIADEMRQRPAATELTALIAEAVDAYEPETPADRRKRMLLDAVRQYHRETAEDPSFVPGVTPIQPAGAVFDESDRLAVAEAALDMRIVSGSSAIRFERDFAKLLGRRKAHMVNSGSSANLVAVSALTSPRLGDRRLRSGDEVITVAAGFPTTVNPIIQNGLIPVFVDVELRTYNASVEAVREAISPRTKAIVMAHTLGNPFAVQEIAELAREHGLWLIEDNCDGLGSTYRGKLTGSFGDLATSSFYPAHHITTGEGGCVVTDNLQLARAVESIRDWGRDCWCEPGDDNTCYKRFQWQLGTLPEGYDHKYTYSHIGYNLKSTDLQAALGVTQLPKVDRFGAARRRNWQRLHDGLADAPGLLLPRATPDSDPSWFGFPLTVLSDAPFTRLDLVSHLEKHKIGTRQLFAGNLTRHPAYQGANYRVSGELRNSDIITEYSFWIGVHPRLTDAMTDYMVESIKDFIESRS